MVDRYGLGRTVSYANGSGLLGAGSLAAAGSIGHHAAARMRRRQGGHNTASATRPTSTLDYTPQGQLKVPSDWRRAVVPGQSGDRQAHWVGQSIDGERPMNPGRPTGGAEFVRPALLTAAFLINLAQAEAKQNPAGTAAFCCRIRIIGNTDINKPEGALSAQPSIDHVGCQIDTRGFVHAVRQRQHAWHRGLRRQATPKPRHGGEVSL
jgi:hypothetical protein